MAKGIKRKKLRRVGARMLLSSAAGNLQLFKEYIGRSGFKNTKEIEETLADIQKGFRKIRNSLGFNGTGRREYKDVLRQIVQEADERRQEAATTT